jgi:hypothetical protein
MQLRHLTQPQPLGWGVQELQELPDPALLPPYPHVPPPDHQEQAAEEPVHRVDNPVAHGSGEGLGRIDNADAATTVGVKASRWNAKTAMVMAAVVIAVLVCVGAAFGSEHGHDKEALLHTVKNGSGWPP